MCGSFHPCCFCNISQKFCLSRTFDWHLRDQETKTFGSESDPCDLDQVRVYFLPSRLPAARQEAWNKTSSAIHWSTVSAWQPPLPQCDSLTTWEVFADDVCCLGGPGHAGVDQNIVLQAQSSQPFACQLSLLAAWRWRQRNTVDASHWLSIRLRFLLWEQIQT